MSPMMTSVRLIFGLNKIDEWTKVAQENNVNRRIEKTASCIPR